MAARTVASGDGWGPLPKEGWGSRTTDEQARELDRLALEGFRMLVEVFGSRASWSVDRAEVTAPAGDPATPEKLEQWREMARESVRKRWRTKE